MPDKQWESDGVAGGGEGTKGLIAVSRIHHSVSSSSAGLDTLTPSSVDALQSCPLSMTL